MATVFDDCFATFPEVKLPTGFDSFWKDSITELKKIPVLPVYKSSNSTSMLWETIQEVSFQSYGNSMVHAKLALPRQKGKRPLVVRFHDYLEPEESFHKGYAELGVAELLVQLRGHSHYELQAPIDPLTQKPFVQWQPGYFQFGLDEPKDFYMKKVYLDVIRTIDFVRLTESLDAEKILLQGKSLGTAPCIFGASFSDRIRGLILETPNFCYISPSQLEFSKNPWVKELKTLASENWFSENLAFFDSLHFASKVKVPIVCTCGLEDDISDPKSIFALFHHFLTDKRMYVYPKEGNLPGKKKQPDINIDFVKEMFGL